MKIENRKKIKYNKIRNKYKKTCIETGDKEAVNFNRNLFSKDENLVRADTSVKIRTDDKGSQQ